ncbi:MAG: serine/threonine-protein kinase [Myxococcota bacterium]
MKDMFGVEQAPVTVGRFELVRRLGSGAMGHVHEARGTNLERSVALKLLGEGAWQRSIPRRDALIREAQSSARLSHPNIVQVYEVGIDGSTVFIAMELVAGKNLQQWVDEDAPDWAEILFVLRQAGEGLAAAHDIGVTHRDFKPENILLEHRLAQPADTAPRLDKGVVGRVCVTDFGLARAGDELASPELAPTPERRGRSECRRDDGLGPGTWAYLSPEHRCGPLTSHSDQFSFCVTLHRALFGRFPFPRGADGRLVFDAARGPTFPKEAHGIPSSVCQAIERGLSIEPSKRHGDMRALLTALDIERRPRRCTGALGALALVAISSGMLMATDRPTLIRGADAGSWPQIDVVGSIDE